MHRRLAFTSSQLPVHLSLSQLGRDSVIIFLIFNQSFDKTALEKETYTRLDRDNLKIKRGDIINSCLTAIAYPIKNVPYRPPGISHKEYTESEGSLPRPITYDLNFGIMSLLTNAMEHLQACNKLLRNMADGEHKPKVSRAQSMLFPSQLQDW